MERDEDEFSEEYEDEEDVHQAFGLQVTEEIIKASVHVQAKPIFKDFACQSSDQILQKMIVKPKLKNFANQVDLIEKVVQQPILPP